MDNIEAEGVKKKLDLPVFVAGVDPNPPNPVDCWVLLFWPKPPNPPKPDILPTVAAKLGTGVSWR